MKWFDYFKVFWLDSLENYHGQGLEMKCFLSYTVNLNDLLNSYVFELFI